MSRDECVISRPDAGVENGINADIGPASRGYFGCVEEFADEIRGWVVNAGQENDPLAIEVLIDGVRTATAYCVRPRVDIAAITGRSNAAGFALPSSALRLPAESRHLLDSDTVVIGFRIKGTAQMVPSLFSPEVTIGDLRKFVARAGGRELSKSELAEAVKPYIEELKPAPEADPDVRLIAFYLPQYHPVPENDEWWGPGFTEWTNVSQAKPQFPGHHQPHIPGELGFYDLRLPEVREAQAKLAREHGIHGFCYYYYWFNGRRILERPLQEVLDSGKPDFPFCICWANETWSRRWDGSEQEVLLKQEHTPESDIAFIRDVIPILKDPRYIRVNGAPLLMVYRASLFPDLRATADTWRRICAEEGIPDIHLCIVESFGFSDPYGVGFDSSVQFPPHGIQPTQINDRVQGLSDDFEGSVYDYEEVVGMELTARQPDHKRFRGVMCAWDNTARRKNRGYIFDDARPELYEVWLRGAVEWTRRHHQSGERLVFINAWNEWAEGTHLEPDTRNGRAYLDATHRVVNGCTSADALFEYGRQANELAGDELATWLKELEARFKEMSVIGEQARRIARRNHVLADGGSIMSDVEPYVLRSLPLIKAAKFVVDRINGLPIGVLTVSQRRECAMYVEGWCVHPEAEVDPRTISYLVLEDIGTKQRFYAPVFGRVPRQDVADAHSDLPQSRSLFSGFKAFLDLRDLKNGEYRLGMIQMTRDSISLNFAEGAVRVC